MLIVLRNSQSTAEVTLQQNLQRLEFDSIEYDSRDFPSGLQAAGANGHSTHPEQQLTAAVPVMGAVSTAHTFLAPLKWSRS